MKTFLRRLEILNYLTQRQRSRLAPAGTELILQHLQDLGYLDDASGNERSQFRLIQRDLNFLLGEQDEDGDYDNDFGLVMQRGQAKSLLWSLQPYQQLHYDFERMPAYMALAMSLSQKHLKQILPSSTQRELSQVFSSAQEKLEKSERKLSASHYLKLTDAVEFFQRGQSLQAPDFDMQVLDRIYQAILMGRRVDIRYRSGKDIKSYSLHPHGVAIMLPKLYLVAKKHEDMQTKSEPQSYEGDDFRHFLIHKIETIELSRYSNFVSDDFQFKAYLEAGNMDLLIDRNDKQCYDLILELDTIEGSSLLQDLRESPIAVNQTLEPVANTRWQLKASVRRTVQLRNWLLALGAEAKVLQPAIIVDDLVQHLQEQLSHYRH